MFRCFVDSAEEIDVFPWFWDHSTIGKCHISIIAASDWPAADEWKIVGRSRRPVVWSTWFAFAFLLYIVDDTLHTVIRLPKVLILCCLLTIPDKIFWTSLIRGCDASDRSSDKRPYIWLSDTKTQTWNSMWWSFRKTFASSKTSRQAFESETMASFRLASLSPSILSWLLRIFDTTINGSVIRFTWWNSSSNFTVNERMPRLQPTTPISRLEAFIKRIQLVNKREKIPVLCTS